MHSDNNSSRAARACESSPSKRRSAATASSWAERRKETDEQVNGVYCCKRQFGDGMRCDPYAGHLPMIITAGVARQVFTKLDEHGVDHFLQQAERLYLRLVVVHCTRGDSFVTPSVTEPHAGWTYLPPWGGPGKFSAVPPCRM